MNWDGERRKKIRYVIFVGENEKIYNISYYLCRYLDCCVLEKVCEEIAIIRVKAPNPD